MLLRQPDYYKATTTTFRKPLFPFLTSHFACRNIGWEHLAATDIKPVWQWQQAITI
jgi:hypothetical protein